MSLSKRSGFYTVWSISLFCFIVVVIVVVVVDNDGGLLLSSGGYTILLEILFAIQP